MKLEPMEAPALPVLTPRVPEPAVEVCFAARLTEREIEPGDSNA
jgi:hypothetical protein